MSSIAPASSKARLDAPALARFMRALS